MSDDVFERLALWPLRLQFVEKEGFGLWGSGDDQEGEDHVLTVAGRLVLMPTLAELRRFVAADITNPMVHLPGYAELRELLGDETVQLSPALTVNYSHALATMTKPSDEWTRDDASDVLDALNLLYDIARALEERDMTERFHTGVYRALADQLTFAAADEIAAALADVDSRAALAALLDDVQRVEQRSGPPVS